MRAPRELLVCLATRSLVSIAACGATPRWRKPVAAARQCARPPASSFSGGMPYRLAVVRLVEARRSIEKTLAGVKAKGRALKKTAAAEMRAGLLPPRVEHAAIIMYVLAGYRADVAVTYLDAQGRQRHWPALLSRDLALMVENMFLQMEVEEIAGLTDPSRPDDPIAFALAAKRVEEWAAVEWARGMNVLKGVAPSSASMVAQAEWRDCPSAKDPHGTPRASATSSRDRNWAARLRRRWGGRYAKLPVAGHLEASELREKAMIARGSVC